MSTHPAPTTITVATAAPYDVLVGHGALDRLPALLPAGAQRVAVVCPESLEGLLDRVLDAYPALAEEYDVTVLQIPDGEEAKTAETASACWDALGEEGFTRSDVVVTLGGGATTDLGGFVAATWLRGVAVVHVPTTLLAMVDAAVGGKTGINTDVGKNLVGSFHEPVGVLCDLALLDTLPREELVSGLAEVIKAGFIADPAILDLVEATDPADLTADSPALRELVERAIRVKADVVAGDLKETAGAAGAAHPGRETLNYGHTLGHAIERASGYALRHGEAVAIGCVYVAELAARTGGLDAAVVERHRSVLARVGLPTSYGGEATFEELLSAMAVDKKARGSVIRFVVLEDLARPVVLAGPSEDDLRAAFEAVSR
ncbi:3-dehydroquinate synthase [Nocardioides sp. GY 10113]|uniref:3-dehydroquinate synthase n=1 Tax=Nocardioides sp. GY 10113 TaxID=2569761 RepID=UPI0010A92BC3|nr:3-dehydroquinate synthase [Nocardioides sp. GY 10113]TIC80368.1 3-dehydroquinate synthase [Nocardioides sp. GY 10113]TIC82471.1 3-dehydroquinate synthase [Nocardioides sp. GY 10113]